MVVKFESIILIAVVLFVIVCLSRFEIMTFVWSETGFADNTYVPVTHLAWSEDNNFNSYWCYYDPNSNLEFNLRKTIVFNTHEDMNKYFGSLSSPKESVCIKTIQEARKQFDSVQITRHNRDSDGLPKFEIIDLQKYHGTLFKIARYGFDKNIRFLQHYRNKNTKVFDPFLKFVLLRGGPNFKLESR